MPKPTIGVVVIAYNFGQYLGEAVGSVLAQTRTATQVVVVDDGSTNETRETVRTLPQRFPGVQVVLAEHGGQAHARNVGIRALETDYVLCLDGDDRLKASALEALAAPLDADPGVGLTYGFAEKFGSETGLTTYEPWDPVQLLDHNFVQPSASMFRRSLLHSAGGWSELLQRTVGGFDDWAFSIAISESGARGVLVPEAVVEYRRHAGADYGRMRRTTTAARAALAKRHLWRYLSTYAPRVVALGPAGVRDPREDIEREAHECDELRARLAAKQSASDEVGRANGNARSARERSLRRLAGVALRPARAALRRAATALAIADFGPVPVRAERAPLPTLPVLKAPERWPRVDIVTVLYNSVAHVPELLESLRALDYPREQLHVFFVDNASSDRSGDMLKRALAADPARSVPHSYVNLGRNAGFTGGCNVAMRASRADFILLLNPDAVAAPDALKVLVARALQERGVGMVEAAMQPIEHPKDYDPVTQETSWCSGAAVLVSRSALQRTGVFDERFFMYCEDIDLSWRMWTHGYRCLYEPRARVLHGQGVMVHKGGSRGYYLALRNGLMMRLVFGGTKRYLRYAAGVAWLALANPGHEKGARKYPAKALVAHLRHLPHLILRRREQTLRPWVAPVQFYGWDYHVRRW